MHSSFKINERIKKSKQKVVSEGLRRDKVVKSEHEKEPAKWSRRKDKPVRGKDEKEVSQIPWVKKQKRLWTVKIDNLVTNPKSFWEKARDKYPRCVTIC